MIGYGKWDAAVESQWHQCGTARLYIWRYAPDHMIEVVQGDGTIVSHHEGPIMPSDSGIEIPEGCLESLRDVLVKRFGSGNEALPLAAEEALSIERARLDKVLDAFLATR